MKYSVLSLTVLLVVAAGCSGSGHVCDHCERAVRAVKGLHDAGLTTDPTGVRYMMADGLRRAAERPSMMEMFAWALQPDLPNSPQGALIAGMTDEDIPRAPKSPKPGDPFSGAFFENSHGVLVQAMKVLQAKIDTHANNLANANTISFKRSSVQFTDLFYRKVRESFTPPREKNSLTVELPVGTGVRLISTEKIFEQGVFERTDNDLDWAIDGEGFYKIRLPDDTVAYTRAGHWNIDADGNLVTPEGYLMDPPITVPENITRILVDQTGIVSGFDPESPESVTEIAQLELCRFINPSGLEAVGDNLYQYSPCSGDEIQGLPAQGAGFGKIRQGYLEQSNVDVISETVELRKALQMYRMIRDIVWKLTE